MTRPSANNPGVDLFPFLAILICTMGTLILLMSVVNRNSGKADPQAVAQAREKIDEQTRLQREELQWRIAHLRNSHAQTSEDLSEERLRLSSAERHQRDLLDQLEQMKRAAQLLQQAGTQADNTKQLTKAELDRLLLAAAMARRQLADSKQRVAQRKPSYSIIPFKGQYGTDRRPIYIECSDEGVTLQPEGVRLYPSDFAGPPGPGNPLASTLRAAREYLSPPRAGGKNESTAEPYPLLLVRPSGVMAYYAVREAMQSWASDFGYDLIEEDWDLEFPPADKKLAIIEQQALAEARQRIEWYVQNASSRSNEKARAKYRVSSARGGLVPEGNVTMGERPPESAWTNGGATRRGGSATAARGGTLAARHGGGSAELPDAPTLSGAANGPPGNGGSGGGGSGLAGNGVSGSGAAGSGFGGTSFVSTPDDAAAGETAPTIGTPGSNAGPSLGGADGGQFVTGTSQPGGSPTAPGNALQSMTTGGTRAPLASGAQSPANGSQANQLGGPRSTPSVQPFGGTRSNYVPSDSNPSGQRGSTINGMTPADALLANAGRPAPDNGPRDRMPIDVTADPMQFNRPGEYRDPLANDVRDSLRELERKQRDQVKKPLSLAATRGANWGIGRATRTSQAITRPIRIDCSADKLIIAPDIQGEPPIVIPLNGRTEESVDKLADTIRDRVQNWGIAGRSMYWKPQLILSVGPSGEGRFADLENLLADSGFDVKRK